MRQNTKFFILITIIILLFGYKTSNAQITIGSSKAPVSGSLLDLKENNDTEINSTKGLGLPKVHLDANNTIKMGDNEILPDQYEAHTGLLVYNIHKLEKPEISDKEDLLCPGLHVWNGSKWLPLSAYPQKGLLCTEQADGRIEIVGGKLYYNVASGHDKRGNPTQEIINLQWQPSTEEVTVLQNATKDLPKVNFDPALKTTVMGDGTNAYKVNPLRMEETTVEDNLYASKEIKLTFRIANYDEDEVEITINQTNYALKILEGTEIKSVIKFREGTTSTEKEFTAQSNSKWEATLTNKSNVITTNQPVVAKGGKELKNATSFDEAYDYTPTLQNYKKYHTAKVLFRDNYPTSEVERYNPIELSILQCTGVEDIDSYGIKDETEDPSAKVQRHYDQDQNTFYSSDFGTAGRWMTTNLAALDYDDRRSDGKPKPLGPLIFDHDTSITAREYPYCSYPGTSNDPADKTEYNKNPHLGVLYGFRATVGHSNLTGIESEKAQGICPYGWHVPSLREWEKLAKELEAHPGKYFYDFPYAPQPDGDFPEELGHITYFNIGAMVKDPCGVFTDTESNAEGMSLPLAEGGFMALFAGGSTGTFGEVAGFATSTYFTLNNNSAKYWAHRDISSNSASLKFFGGGAGHQYSLRCVKDED